MPIMSYNLREAMETQGFQVKPLPKDAKHEVNKTYWCGYWCKLYTVLETETNEYGIHLVKVYNHDGRIVTHGTSLDPRRDYEVILPILSLENAEVGSFYKFCDGWQRVEKIYRITEEYAKAHELYCLDRVTTIDFNGNKCDFALTSCNS
jgi:hypothetical protein